MKETQCGVDLVANWRNSAEQGNPAGLLFAAGQFAEADIIQDCVTQPTAYCGTQCSGSYTHYCC